MKKIIEKIKKYFADFSNDISENKSDNGVCVFRFAQIISLVLAGFYLYLFEFIYVIAFAGSYIVLDYILIKKRSFFEDLYGLFPSILIAFFTGLGGFIITMVVQLIIIFILFLILNYI